jgi:hypothetical protein
MGPHLDGLTPRATARSSPSEQQPRDCYPGPVSKPPLDPPGSQGSDGDSGGVTVLSAAPTSRDVVRVLYRLAGRVRITDVHLTGEDPYLRDVHGSRGIECYGASDLGGEDWHAVLAAAEEVAS